HTMDGVEVIMGDGHVRGGRALAGFNGDVVVARVDEAVGDGDVGGIAGIDTIGVARALARRPELDTPDGETVAAVIGDVKVGRVLQRDAVEGEIVAVV